MSADLIARLIKAGTPAQLVADVAMALGSAAGRVQADQDAMESRRASERARSQRYRARGGGQIPGWLRREVFERDEYCCVDCGAEDQLECDHVIPLIRGGPTDFDNLQTLCKPCNARKRDRVRKADVRGQTRTNSDKLGIARKDEEARDETPAPSPPSPFSPQTPLKPQPQHPHHRDVAPPRKGTGFAEPDGVTVEQWAGFTGQRKKKLTERAYALLCRKLTDIAARSGWPPGDLIDLATERGWETIYEPKDQHRHDHRPRNGQHWDGTGCRDHVLDAFASGNGP